MNGEITNLNTLIERADTVGRVEERTMVNVNHPL